MTYQWVLAVQWMHCGMAPFLFTSPPRCKRYYARPRLYSVRLWRHPCSARRLPRRLFRGGRELTRRPHQTTSHSAGLAFQFFGRLRGEGRNSFSVVRGKTKTEKSASAPREFGKLCSQRGFGKLCSQRGSAEGQQGVLAVSSRSLWHSLCLLLLLLFPTAGRWLRHHSRRVALGDTYRSLSQQL